MYHKVDDQERNPQAYVLTQMDPAITEDECHDFMNKPRQTQRTIGFYLRKIQGAQKHEEVEKDPTDEKRFALTAGSHDLERELRRNKGFWTGRPERWAHLTYKLRDKYTVDIPQKDKKGQGIFYRPYYMELDHHIKLANAGLLYSDEESEEEEEQQPDDTACVPLRKTRYKVCDPCKPKKEKKKKDESEPAKTTEDDPTLKEGQSKFKKIPTGCQCDYVGPHDHRPEVWDNPFEDPMDMLRQHEMNKYMKPFKREILNKNYEKNPPVKFMAREAGMKRTFPVYLISNL